MESYSGSEHGTSEIYMIQGSESNPHLATTPSLGQLEVMGSEGSSEFIVDQGLFYPAANNYYGYYCTGFEPTGEWDDNHRIFGLDNPNLQYAGLQTENLPYVYYTPSYGYAQSPYNPYNPYIPGAVIGVDGSYVGMQQYYTGSTYQNHASSPAYYPYLVQPMTENVASNAQEPHLLNAGVPNANSSDGPGFKYNHQSASGGSGKVPSRASLGDGDKTFNQSHSSGKRSEVSKANSTNKKQPATHTTTASVSVSRAASAPVTQGRNASALVQPADQLTFGQVPSLSASAKVSLPVTNVSSDFGTNARGWPMVDRLRPRFPSGGVSNNGNGNPDFLSEQNRGPRTNRSRGQWTPSASVQVKSTNVGNTGASGKIIINADQYNKEDFSVSYANGKFFVIKSYSEDDVHKSIKYNVWSSTPNGNKRLENAYEDAQKIASGNSRGCPVFLFFSVNASGQFCGVAEMVGPVDFNKDMEFWQQDKWSGSFPVKWHIVKDVPNTYFRHIILENNENKPVTNSRDTQEIKIRQGVEMLKIFKNHTLKTSIIDDFMYYEERQKIMQEEKARLHGKSYDSSFYIPAYVPLNKTSGVAHQPLSSGEIDNTNEKVHPSISGRTVASTNEKVPVDQDVTNSLGSGEGSTMLNSFEDTSGVTSVLKIGSLTIDPKLVEAKPSAAVTLANTEAVDVFTVGSMPVKVNGFSEASSEILTVGSIPIVRKGLAVDMPSAETSSKDGV
ncbi:Yth domain-containing protein ect4 [Thalictrum thalictroides]|uniref:YTH domain-containing family protein n=1 Tax=Thalictrum thalictroides TaxID=46969 RepID=A0A7J6XFV0_THATH|nr:Yth domain-containing protein ect4 [Thalictrum thalictroides]